jgi:hypothetical protein
MDPVHPVPQPEVTVLELGREGPAAEERPLAGGDGQGILRGVALGIGDVQQLALGQGAGQQLEVLPKGVDLPGVAVPRQMTDRHGPVAGNVEPALDRLDVLASTRGAPVGGHRGQ